jgi:PPM family protein phosphatase
VVSEATSDVALCPSCNEPVVNAAARFCEACGTALTGEPDDEAHRADQATATTAPTPPPDAPSDGCARCGAEVGADGYCLSCGLRAIEPITVEDRGRYAFATHRGRRHERNEDAGALATTGEGWPILVVSDGVSASPNPHLASAAAVGAVTDELDGRPFIGDADLVRAVAAAHQAASAVPADGDPLWVSDGSHPACTIVVAVAAAGVVHVANVGDARAYLLSAREPGDADDAAGWSADQLSTDDSVAALAVDEGMQPAVALSLPGGHAITAWLGADAPDPAVHLATHPVRTGDLVLACSDGLWNYAPTDESLADQVAAALPPSTDELAAAKVCEQLVAWANGEGGSDNICVALAPVVADDDEEEAS